MPEASYSSTSIKFAPIKGSNMGSKRLNLVDYPADCCRIRPLAPITKSSAQRIQNRSHGSQL